MPLEARPLESSRTVRLMASAAMLAVLALTAAGCRTTNDDVTGSISSSAQPRSDAEWRRSLDTWGARYRANPDDAEAAMMYARGLRATDQRVQAVAVLEQASLRNSSNMAVIGAYGRALAEAGDLGQALEVLSRAHTPDNPDWRILNAQGAVLDQMGRHAEAQKNYTQALQMAPDDPSILSNLGMSYLLMKDLARAESTLRRALARPNSDPKVRQNLALIVGLRGDAGEAERIAREGVSPAEASANVEYLRQMLARQHEAKKPAAARPPRPQQRG